MWVKFVFATHYNNISGKSCIKYSSNNAAIDAAAIEATDTAATLAATPAAVTNGVLHSP